MKESVRLDWFGNLGSDPTKKGSDPTGVESYRPISNLPALHTSFCSSSIRLFQIVMVDQSLNSAMQSAILNIIGHLITLLTPFLIWLQHSMLSTTISFGVDLTRHLGGLVPLIDSFYSSELTAVHKKKMKNFTSASILTARNTRLKKKQENLSGLVAV